MSKRTICIIVIFSFLVAVLPAAPSAYAQTQQPTVSLSPSTESPTQVGQVFDLTISISNVQGLWGWDADLSWNPQYLNLTTLTEGDFLYSQVGGTGSTLFTDIGANNRNTRGFDEINDAATSNSTASGTGTLASLGFTVLERFSQTAIQANFTLLGPAPSVTTKEGTKTVVTSGPNPIITPVSSTSQTTVTLQTNLPPEANAGPNQTVRAGAPVVLNASLSVSNGNNATYTWTFLDVTQQTLTGKIVTYTFKNVGTYLITLTVQDSLGSDTSTVTVTVINATYTPATITISGERAIGQPIRFAIDTSTLRNVTVSDYSWSMGDGKPPTETHVPTLTYTYGADGTYSVNVTISYSDGVTDFTTTSVTIGQGSSTSTPTSTPTISSNPTAAPNTSANPNVSTNTGTNEESLPPTILGIIIAFTIFILVGSIFWLRNPKNRVQSQESSS